ncbi:MAG TPA: phosphatase PAP2 family protein [Bryobacteraceae bacterium]|nr:phosphatase PAP2 family protein [Bryobacteraceae bacterium]
MERPPIKLLYAGFGAAVAALLLFAWLANEVLQGDTLRFDTAVRDTIHSWASPQLTIAMRGITQLGAPTFLIFITLFLILCLIWMGRRRAAMVLTVGSLGALLLNELLKHLFHRVRPEAFFGYVEPLGYSFPSGHSISSACFYGVAAAIITTRMRSRARRALVWAGAALLAGLIGFSRIYLGVHYPSDVIAAYAAAIVWVAALRAGYGAWLRALRNRARQEERSTG